MCGWRYSTNSVPGQAPQFGAWRSLHNSGNLFNI
jgi:hypothetical protein